MGWFSPKKTISVASSLYNLAGPETDRINYLKSSIFGAVIAPDNRYLGESIVNNYLSGPGVKQRQFHLWAKNNFPLGSPVTTIKRSYNVDPVVVSAEIPTPALPAGLLLELQNSFVEASDFTYFAEQYLMTNNPDLLGTAWIAEYDSITQNITIQFEGGSTTMFNAPDYGVDENYLVAYYYHYLPNVIEPVVLGTPVLGVTDPSLLPSNIGFTDQGTVIDSSTSANLDTRVQELITYDDGRPDETADTTTTTTQAYNLTTNVHSQVVYGGVVAGSSETRTIETFNKISTNYNVVQVVTVTSQNYTISGGVIKTIQTTTTVDTLTPIYEYQVDTQDTIEKRVVGGMKMFIYKMGSGTAALDALELDEDTSPLSEFFPFIPLRLGNTPINAAPYDTDGTLDEVKKAYRKGFSSKPISKILADIENNPHVGDIDYCYLTFGVPLNVVENSSRKYIYAFFKTLIPFQNTSSATMTAFTSNVAAYETLHMDLEVWTVAQNNPADPLYNTVRPSVNPLGSPDITTIKLKSGDARTASYDHRLSWVNITEELFPGVGKVGAKKGEVWLEEAATLDWDERRGYSGNPLNGDLATPYSVNHSLKTFYVYYQTDTNNYKRLTVYGMVHNNYVYGGKSVQTDSGAALADTDPSGFLIPIHYQTFKSLSIVDYTQMGTSNSFIIFNSYEVYVQKWYNTFLFRILLMILVIVVSVLVNPGAIGAASGIFGTNLAVGAGLGLTGTAAIIVGAIANGLAAMIVGNIVSKASAEVFGDELGAIISSLLSSFIIGGLSGNTFDFNSLSTPQGLLRIGSVLANAYSGWTAGNITDINAQMNIDQKEFKDQTDEINRLIRELGGNNGLLFNPLSLTDTGNGNGYTTFIPESADEFIHRTTMTGSEIVDITLSMTTEYSNLNLKLPRN